MQSSKYKRSDTLTVAGRKPRKLEPYVVAYRRKYVRKSSYHPALARMDGRASIGCKWEEENKLMKLGRKRIRWGVVSGEQILLVASPVKTTLAGCGDFYNAEPGCGEPSLQFTGCAIDDSSRSCHLDQRCRAKY